LSFGVVVAVVVKVTVGAHLLVVLVAVVVLTVKKL
jgi:hypothetical protein